MRIKTIEIQGFKSFVDRTVVRFEEGVTGVVGPNGCGKSNVVDAIRWVMGEQSAKHLRGGSMEDVIFNGAESRQPMGMAQVFMTFDNADGRAPAEYATYSEIQIGRRLYRSGESEYFINKTACRLKDIVDLFLGTGVGTKAYSIIEQGKIGQIISTKPEDRRMLIEEAAGISKFKSRKEAALRKMESTRANLARLDDILGELSRQIGSLGRQVKKAERHQRVAHELREREMVLAAAKYRTMSAELDEFANRRDLLKEAELAQSSELAQHENELDTLRLNIAELERELDGAQQELYAVRNAVRLGETTITHKKQEQANLARHSAALARELEEIKTRLAGFDERIAHANEEKIRADLALAGSTDDVSGIEDGVNDMRARHQECARGVENDKLSAMHSQSGAGHERARMEDLERRRIDLNGRIARNQSEIDSIDAREKSLRDEHARLAGELGRVRQLKLELEGEHDSLKDTLAEQRAALEKAEGVWQEHKDRLAAKKSRHHSLKELRDNLEGYRDGVRAVLKRSREAQDALAGIVGTVGDFIETDAPYERALSAVLGERLQGVVVTSQQEGLSAIDYLKSSACGRSTFIPVDVRTRAAGAQTAMPDGDGVIGRLTDFVRCADEHRPMGDYLMGDVVLVQDLPRALDIWRASNSGATLVTMDGEVVDPAGVVTGGAGGSAEESIIVQRREMLVLEEEIAVLSSACVSAEGEVIRLRERVAGIEKHIENVAKSGHGEDIRIVSQERDVARLGDELMRYDHERDRLSVEIAALTGELADVEREHGETTARIAALTAEEIAARERLVAAEAILADLATQLTRDESALFDRRVTLAQASEREVSVSRELDGLVASKAEALIAVDRRCADIGENNRREACLTREIDEITGELNTNLCAVDGLEKSRTVLSERYEQATERVRSREIDIREMRKRHTSTSGEAHAVEIDYTERRGRLDHLVENMRERYRIDIVEVHAQYPAPEGFDADAEEATVVELRERLERIGPVNVDAIGEFDELTQRHDFLNRQRQDLGASLENLSKAIARINRTSRQRFRSTFEAVDAQFQQLFPKLFRGGKARLMLTDEENLLETGVEIVAQPPGKKLQSITLLSGGEKALTAVALIFSIFLIKPSPFCLLDEVDAPLDDANIDRFNDLIRGMTPHSQFILITHNKRTMELADLLYGVTMEEAGVSKLVSVRLNQGEIQPAVA